MRRSFKQVVLLTKAQRLRKLDYMMILAVTPVSMPKEDHRLLIKQLVDWLHIWTEVKLMSEELRNDLINYFRHLKFKNGFFILKMKRKASIFSKYYIELKNKYFFPFLLVAS